MGRLLQEEYVKLREGEENVNHSGSLMKIIKYNSQSNITVLFPEYDYITYNRRYDEFKDGRIRSPFDKTLYKMGYIGVGEYEYNKKLKEVHIWSDMLRRCYSEDSLLKRPTYIKCTVCQEWLNFQNFAQWWHENYYEVDNQTMNLDKDILYKGNKVYSPNTCVIVPQNINKLFIKSDASRGEYPIGVNYHKRDNIFESSCSTYENEKGKKIYLGRFNDSSQAFYKGYKPFKEQYIKQIADKYKDKIPFKLYEAMYNWKVEITD